MTTHQTPQDAYEDFRANYEGSPGEAPLLPWVHLSEEEKQHWTKQFENYYGIPHTTDGHNGVSHGDPEITQHRRPRS